MNLNIWICFDGLVNYSETLRIGDDFRCLIFVERTR